MLKPSRLLRFAVIGAVMLLIAAACGGDDDGDSAGDSDTPTPATTGSTEITLVAENITFDQTELTIAAGQEVTITYDHRDADESHNLHIFAEDEGDFVTEIEVGPVTQTLTFTISTPGTYTF